MITTVTPSGCMEQNSFPSALGEVSHLHRGLHREAAYERKREVKNEELVSDFLKKRPLQA